jgi:hypothetical protein
MLSDNKTFRPHPKKEYTLRQSGPSPRFMSPGLGRLPPDSQIRVVCLRFRAGLFTAVRSNTPPKGRRGSTLKTFWRNFQENFKFAEMPFFPSGGSRSVRFQISTHESN